jgi:hypothetical protein
MIKEDQGKKIFMLIVAAIFNKFSIAYYYIQRTSSVSNLSPLSIFLYVFIGIILILEIAIVVRIRIASVNHTQITSLLIMVYFLLLIGASFAQCWTIPHESRLFQIFLCEILINLSFLH